MKKLFAYSAMTALCSPVIFAAQQTWTGQISDACAIRSRHDAEGRDEDERQGMRDGLCKVRAEVHSIERRQGLSDRRQTVAGLAANAGGTVKVTGEASADGGSIKIAKLEPVAKK